MSECGNCEFFKYSKKEKDFICTNPQSDHIYDVVSVVNSCDDYVVKIKKVMPWMGGEE